MRRHLSTTHLSPLPSSPAAAFTLVELLVVISIIALLIAILLPALEAASEAAYAIQCASNQREIGRAALLYAEDHDGWHDVNKYERDPEEDTWPDTLETYHWGERYEKLGYIQPGPEQNPGTSDAYNKVFACPSTEIINTNYVSVYYSGLGMLNSALRGGDRSGWHMADHMGIPRERIDLFGSTNYDPVFLRITYAPRPTEVPFLGDSWSAEKPWRGSPWIQGYNNNHGWNLGRGALHTRHPGSGGGSTNMWFLDGHVSRLEIPRLADIGEGFTAVMNDEREQVDPTAQ